MHKKFSLYLVERVSHVSFKPWIRAHSGGCNYIGSNKPTRGRRKHLIMLYGSFLVLEYDRDRESEPSIMNDEMRVKNGFYLEFQIDCFIEIRQGRGTG